MRFTLIYIIVILFLTTGDYNAQTGNPYNANLVVALDGTGDFPSIQSAIDFVPDGLTSPIKIFIKNGKYKEKIFINKNFITLIGESREGTSIVFPELRRKWREENNDQDWGSAVINISDSVNNLTLVNLFIYNNFGSLYDDHDHQFTIRGGGTKISLINCYIKSDGGDALSLWNTKNGMYYHARSKFEGWVDFVCPRGWCYITDSEFYSYSKTASIWHDGSFNKDQKFVIRNSSFDGIPNFPLGRNHRDGQFFLINCNFSKNMIDTPIYYVRYPDSTKNKPIYWGGRYFYNNCHRDGGDFDWYKNNLEEYSPNLKASKINSSWVFNNKWEPESELKEFLISSNYAIIDGVLRDTTFTRSSEEKKVKNNFPESELVKPIFYNNVKTFTDIVYTTYGKRKMHVDLYLPIDKEADKKPTILMIHGGGWSSGDKKMEQPMALKLASQGYAVVAVEYRLSPEAIYPATIKDLNNAVKWIINNSNIHNFDPNLIITCGGSAGGELATYLGVTNKNIKAVINMDGIVDFTDANESGKDTLAVKPSAGKRWFGYSYKDKPELWVEASPINHINKDIPLMLFINSSIKRFRAGRDIMIDSMKRKNIYYSVYEFENAPHTFWMFETWYEKTMEVITNFLKKIEIKLTQ